MPSPLSDPAEHPPQRFVAGPLVLEGPDTGAAEAMADAVTASLSHLRPWMPWATAENATVESQRTRLEQAAEFWREGSAYIYTARLAADDGSDGGVVGTFGLHRRIGPGGIEIGYWMHVDHTGRGLATRVVRELTALAFTLRDVSWVEIHTDEGNLRSAAIPRRLGYQLDRVDEREPSTESETGRLQIWVTP